MRKIYCFGQDLSVTDLEIKEKLDKVISTKLVQFHPKEKIITKITSEQYCLHEQKQITIDFNKNKNRRKAIFNWAAKGLLF